MTSRLVLLFVCLFSAKAFAFQTIFLVRHAEKVDDSRDSDLSLPGKKRAIDLALLLRDAGIQSIYVSEFQRTQKTAAPLAELLHIKVQVADKDSKKLASQLLQDKSDKAALVVAHADTLPEILAGLGVRGTWFDAHNDFDRLLVLTMGKPIIPLLLRY